jgi:hypothetical protein
MQRIAAYRPSSSLTGDLTLAEKVIVPAEPEERHVDLAGFSNCFCSKHQADLYLSGERRQPLPGSYELTFSRPGIYLITVEWSSDYATEPRPAPFWEGMATGRFLVHVVQKSGACESEADIIRGVWRVESERE